MPYLLAACRCRPIFVLFAACVFSAAPLLADSFDWRNVDGANWNTLAKNQFGGTCWDFGPSGALEAHYKLSRNDASFDPDISEQQICWETSPDMGSTAGGGGFDLILNYFTTHGVVADALVPHDPNHEDTPVAYPDDPWPLTSVFPAPDSWINHVWKASGWSSTSEATLKAKIKSNGPLVIGFNADDIYTTVADLKARYVFHTPTDNHSVSLIGYADDPTCPTGGYWIIKNSWGTETGEDGFEYVPYNSSIDAGLNHLYSLNGPVYYSGAMATVTWGGGTGTWRTGGGNWSGTDEFGGALPTYAWENKETSATFNASSTGTAVTLDGKVIAHGLTISSGATGYVFSGTNSASLTLTAAGMTINESATFNVPVFIGGPQSWTVGSGKTLTIGSDVHTIISNLTIAGAGNVVLSGLIDGGGVINAQGAAPGSLTKTSTGTLTFTGGGNTIVNMALNAGSTLFAQPAGVTATYSGVISGGGAISKTGGGTVIFSGANGYSSNTTVSAGALQADSGAGLPSGSVLVLDGGVLQSNGTATFTRSLGSSGSNKFQFTTNGGGFAAGANPFAIKMNSGTASVSWGTASTNINGTLKFGSASAANVVTLQNAINLTGATRTIDVTDNPNSSADWAVMSGVITYGSGTAGITKTGNGALVLSGANTYNGTTTISGGALQADCATGLPNASRLTLDGGVLQSNAAVTFNRVFTSGAPDAKSVTWNSGGFSAGGGKMTVNLYGDGRTIGWGTNATNSIVGAMILSSTSAQYETAFQNGLALNGAVRTIQVDDNAGSTGDYATIYGAIVNGSATGGITKTGSGRLVLAGNNTYSGATTIAAGTLVFQNPTNILSSSITNNGVLEFSPAASISFSGAISGAGGFTKSGTATLTFAGSTANSYSGTTLVSGGTLVLAKTSGVSATGGAISMTDVSGGGSTYIVLGADGQTASTGALGFANSYANGYFELAGHSTTVGGLSDATGRGIVEGRYDNTGIATDSVLTVNQSGASSFNGTLRDKSTGTGAGRLKLVKSGDGTLTLVGANTGGYTGGLTVTGGLLDYSGGVLPVGDYTVAGGTLSTGALSKTITNIHLTGGTLNGSGTLTTSSPLDLQSGTLNAIFPTGTGLVKSAAGTVTLGTTLTGGYVVSGGVLNLGNLSPTIASLQLAGGTVSGNGTLTSTTAYDLQSGGIGILLGGTVGINKSTAGTVTFSASLPGGRVTMSDGLLDIGSSTRAVTSLQMTGGTITGTGTLGIVSASTIQAGTIDVALGGSVAASLTKSSAATAVVTKDCNNNGATNVSAGTLQLGVGGATGNVGGNIVIQSAGTLNINRSSAVSYASKISGAGTLVQSGSGTVTLTGSNTFSGNVTITGGTLDYSGNSTLAAGNYTINAGTLNTGTLAGSIAGLRITGGAVSGTGTLTSSTAYDIQAGQVTPALAGSVGLNKTGEGTAVLAGANSYSGLTTVSYGTLKLTTAAASTVFSLGGASLAAHNLGGGTIEVSKLVFDYSGGSDPASTIQGLLAASCDSGAWDVGKFLAPTASSLGLTLGWFDDPTAHTVTVMPTYAGDFNLDGLVDAADLGIWSSNAGKTASWTAGDANYDGAVNLADLLSLKSKIGQPRLTLPSAATAAVPEPGTLALLAIGLLGLIAYRHEKRE